MTNCYIQTDTNIGIKAVSYNDINTDIFNTDYLSKAVLSTAFVGILCASNPLQIESEKDSIEPVSVNQILDSNRQDLSLIAKIREKSIYPDNWDGNGAKKVNKETINDAENFIRTLLENNLIHSPIISLATDGEINFLWILDNFRFDLGFYGDKTFSYYGKTSEGEEFMSDETDIIDGLPDSILAFISK